MSDRYRDMAKRIGELAKLELGWLELDTPPISPEAIGGAMRMLGGIRDIIGDDSPTWPHIHVYPTPEGGVQFEWDARPRGLELRVKPDGSHEYARFNDPDPDDADDALPLAAHVAWITEKTNG